MGRVQTSNGIAHCLLRNLIHRCSWWYYTWYNLHESAVTDNTPARSGISSISNSVVTKRTLINKHQPSTHFHVASFATPDYLIYRSSPPHWYEHFSSVDSPTEVTTCSTNLFVGEMLLPLSGGIFLSILLYIHMCMFFSCVLATLKIFRMQEDLILYL